MSTSAYSVTVPVFIHKLSNLSNIIGKAAAHAAEKKHQESAYTQARLFPDMFAFARQVQIACDNAKNGSARLAGTDWPKFDDTEVTFADLQERIAKTIAFLKTLTPEQFADADTRAIVHEIPAINKTYNFVGQDYVVNWVMPNFYFHITTAYNLLRHNGVAIGKGDFLGA